MLLIDVVGYSALAEQLGRTRELGPEALVDALNETLAPCLQAVADHGGEVTHFAGDAFVATFSAEPSHGLAVAVETGASCALRCIDGLRGQQVRVRVVLTAGLVEFELIDVDGSLHLLVGGATVDELYAAAALGEAGRVLVLHGASLRLAAHRLERDAGGNLWLAARASPKDVGPIAAQPGAGAAVELLEFVPVRVRGLEAEGRAAVAEYRQASVVFLQVREPVGANSQERFEVLQDSLGAAVQVVKNLGGQLVQLVRDDKGLVLLAAWGLPGCAYPDSAQRALLAAAECVHALAGRGSPARAGVVSGVLYVGRRGTLLRCEWSIVGAVVNLAALLMSRAEAGEVLAEPECTRLLVGRPLQSGPPRLIERKHGAGSLVAVPIRRANAAVVAARGPVGPIVGRDRELEHLNAALVAWQEAGGVAFTVLSGDPGIGKTQLLQHFLEQAKQRGYPVDQLWGHPLDADIPYRTISHLLEARFAASCSNRESWRRAGLALLDYPHAEADLDTFSTIMNQAARGVQAAAQAAEDTVTASVRRLLFAALGSQHRGPLILAVDDAQWLDPASLALLGDLLRNLDSVMVVAAARPELLERQEWLELARRAKPTMLPLSLLEVEHIDLLSRYTLQVERLPDGFAEVIHRQTFGSPIFTIEFIESLRKAGTLKIDGARCTLAGTRESGIRGTERAIAEAGVPSNLSALIAYRLDALGSECRTVLKAASAIGLTLSVSDLRALTASLGLNGPLTTQLQKLVETGLLSLDPGHEQASFTHSLIRQTIHDQLLPSERREIHGQLAAHLEAHSSERSVPLALLAYHYREASDEQNALRYLERAGRAALAAGAAREAIRSLERAVALAAERRSSAERALLQHDLGRAFLLLSDYAAARTCFERALLLSEHAPPRSVFAQAALVVWEALGQMMHRLLPQLFVARASRRPAAELPNHDAALVSTYDLLVQVYFYSQQPLLALFAALRALNLSERWGLRAGAARAYSMVGGMLGVLPWRDASRAYCRRALDAAERLEDGPDRLWTWLVVAASSSGRGEWELANKLLERCAKVAQLLGDNIRWIDAVGNHGCNLIFAGSIEEGHRMLEDARSRAYAIRDARYQAAADRASLFSLLVQGDLPVLRERLARVRESLERDDLVEAAVARAEMSAVQAWFAAIEGREAEARQNALGALLALEKATPAAVFYNAAWVAVCVAGILAAPDHRDREARRGDRLLARFERVYPYLTGIGIPGLRASHASG